VVQAKSWERDGLVTAPLTYGRPERARGRYLDPIFSDVDIERDVVYRDTVDSAGNPVQLQLDIYQPAGDTATRRPAVMWMHGGFFVAGDKADMADQATEYARRGYVAVSINYRLRPAWDNHGMFLASLDAYDDAVAAVEWLRAHATDYRLDPDTIVAAGFSAGAVTAANLAYLPGRRGPATSPVAGAVVDSGLVYTVPERGDPPVIALHDTDDSTTPYDSIRPLCDWARQVHAPCDLVTYVGHGHGAPSTADLIERSARFLAEHVLEPRGYLDAGHRCTAVGTPGDDRLVGTRRDDVLCGRGGHDVLIGRGGNDRLFGGTGDDRLQGGPGDDQLLGGPDRDRADGGPGRDTCDVERPKSCSP
jgi:predicted esterase